MPTIMVFIPFVATPYGGYRLKKREDFNLVYYLTNDG